MEPRDHGLEYEEDVRPQPRLTRPCAAWRRESRRLPVNRGEITTRSGRHQTSGGSWQRQNRPRRSATKPQSDGLLGLATGPEPAWNRRALKPRRVAANVNAAQDRPGLAETGLHPSPRRARQAGSRWRAALGGGALEQPRQPIDRLHHLSKRCDRYRNFGHLSRKWRQQTDGLFREHPKIAFLERSPLRQPEHRLHQSRPEHLDAVPHQAQPSRLPSVMKEPETRIQTPSEHNPRHPCRQNTNRIIEHGLHRVNGTARRELGAQLAKPPLSPSPGGERKIVRVWNERHSAGTPAPLNASLRHQARKARNGTRSRGPTDHSTGLSRRGDPA